ncbi:MAG: hypothetical protein AAF684_07685, partial [Pseudomonadota bacterium]
KLISLPDVEESKPVEPAFQPVAPLSVDDVAADDAAGSADDPTVFVPAQLWRQVNQTLGGVSSVTFDLRIKQQAVAAFFFGETEPALRSAPPPNTVDVEA